MVNLDSLAIINPGIVQTLDLAHNWWVVVVLPSVFFAWIMWRALQ